MKEKSQISQKNNFHQQQFNNNSIKKSAKKQNSQQQYKKYSFVPDNQLSNTFKRNPNLLISYKNIIQLNNENHNMLLDSINILFPSKQEQQSLFINIKNALIHKDIQKAKQFMKQFVNKYDGSLWAQNYQNFILYLNLFQQNILKQNISNILQDTFRQCSKYLIQSTQQIWRQISLLSQKFKQKFNLYTLKITQQKQHQKIFSINKIRDQIANFIQIAMIQSSSRQKKVEQELNTKLQQIKNDYEMKLMIMQNQKDNLNESISQAQLMICSLNRNIKIGEDLNKSLLRQIQNLKLNNNNNCINNQIIKDNKNSIKVFVTPERTPKNILQNNISPNSIVFKLQKQIQILKKQLNQAQQIIIQVKQKQIQCNKKNNQRQRQFVHLKNQSVLLQDKIKNFQQQNQTLKHNNHLLLKKISQLSWQKQSLNAIHNNCLAKQSIENIFIEAIIKNINKNRSQQFDAQLKVYKSKNPHSPLGVLIQKLSNQRVKLYKKIKELQLKQLQIIQYLGTVLDIVENQDQWIQQVLKFFSVNNSQSYNQFQIIQLIFKNIKIKPYNNENKEDKTQKNRQGDLLELQNDIRLLTKGLKNNERDIIQNCQIIWRDPSFLTNNLKKQLQMSQKQFSKAQQSRKYINKSIQQNFQVKERLRNHTIRVLKLQLQRYLSLILVQFMNRQQKIKQQCDMKLQESKKIYENIITQFQNEKDGFIQNISRGQMLIQTLKQGIKKLQRRKQKIIDQNSKDELDIRNENQLLKHKSQETPLKKQIQQIIPATNHEQKQNKYEQLEYIIQERQNIKKQLQKQKKKTKKLFQQNQQKSEQIIKLYDQKQQLQKKVQTMRKQHLYNIDQINQKIKHSQQTNKQLLKLNNDLSDKINKNEIQKHTLQQQITYFSQNLRQVNQKQQIKSNQIYQNKDITIIQQRNNKIEYSSQFNQNYLQNKQKITFDQQIQCQIKQLNQKQIKNNQKHSQLLQLKLYYLTQLQQLIFKNKSLQQYNKKLKKQISQYQNQQQLINDIKVKYQTAKEDIQKFKKQIQNLYDQIQNKDQTIAQIKTCLDQSKQQNQNVYSQLKYTQKNNQNKDINTFISKHVQNISHQNQSNKIMQIRQQLIDQTKFNSFENKNNTLRKLNIINLTKNQSCKQSQMLENKQQDQMQILKFSNRQQQIKIKQYERQIRLKEEQIKKLNKNLTFALQQIDQMKNGSPFALVSSSSSLQKHSSERQKQVFATNRSNLTNKSKASNLSNLSNIQIENKFSQYQQQLNLLKDQVKYLRSQIQAYQKAINTNQTSFNDLVLQNQKLVEIVNQYQKIINQFEQKQRKIIQNKQYLKKQEIQIKINQLQQDYNNQKGVLKQQLSIINEQRDNLIRQIEIINQKNIQLNRILNENQVNIKFSQQQTQLLLIQLNKYRELYPKLPSQLSQQNSPINKFQDIYAQGRIVQSIINPNSQYNSSEYKDSKRMKMSIQMDILQKQRKQKLFIKQTQSLRINQKNANLKLTEKHKRQCKLMIARSIQLSSSQFQDVSPSVLRKKQKSIKQKFQNTQSLENLSIQQQKQQNRSSNQLQHSRIRQKQQQFKLIHSDNFTEKKQDNVKKICEKQLLTQQYQFKIKHLQIRINEMQNEQQQKLILIKKYKDQIKQIKQQKNKLNKLNKQLQQKFNNLQKQIAQLNTWNQQLKQQNQYLKGQLQIYKRKSLINSNFINTSINSHLHNKQRIKIQDQQLSIKKLQNQQLQLEKQQLKKQNQIMKSYIKDINTQYQNKHNQYISIHQQLLSNKEQTHVLKQQIDSLQIQLNFLKQTSQNLKKQRNKVSQQNNRKEKQLKQLKQQNKSFQKSKSQLSILEQENRSLKKEIQQQAQIKFKELKAMQNQKIQMAKKIRTLNLKNDQLEIRLKQFEAQVIQLRKQHLDDKHHAQKMQRQLQIIIHQKTQIEKDVKRVEQHFTKINEKLKNQNDQIKNRIKSFENEQIIVLKKQVQNLQNKQRQYAKQKRENQMKVQQKNCSIRKLQQKVFILNGQNIKLRHLIQQKAGKITQQENIIQKSQNQYKKKQNQIQKIRQTYKKFEEKIELTQRQLIFLQNQNQQLIQQLNKNDRKEKQNIQKLKNQYQNKITELISKNSYLQRNQIVNLRNQLNLVKILNTQKQALNGNLQNVHKIQLQKQSSIRQELQKQILCLNKKMIEIQNKNKINNKNQIKQLSQIHNKQYEQLKEQIYLSQNTIKNQTKQLQINKKSIEQMKKNHILQTQSLKGVIQDLNNVIKTMELTNKSYHKNSMVSNQGITVQFKRQIQMLKDNIKMHKSQQQQLRQQVRNYKIIIQQIKLKYSHIQIEKNSFKDKINLLQSQSKRIENQHFHQKKSFEKNIRQLQFKLQQIKQENAWINRKNQDNISHLEKESKSLLSQLSYYQKEFLHIQNTNTNDLLQLKRINLKIQHQSQQKSKNIITLEEKNSYLKGQLKENKNQIQKLQFLLMKESSTSQRKIKQQVTCLKARIKQLQYQKQSQCLKSIKIIDQQKILISDFNRQIQELTLKVNQKNQKNQKYLSSAKTIKSATQYVNQDCNNPSSEISNEQYEDKIRQNQQIINLLKWNNQQLKKTNRQLQKDNQQKQYKLLSILDNKQQLSHKLHLSQQQVVKKDNIIKGYIKQIENFNKDSQTQTLKQSYLKNSVERIQTQAKQKDQKILILRKKNKNLLIQKNTYLQQIQKLKYQLDVNKKNYLTYNND